MLDDKCTYRKLRKDSAPAEDECTNTLNKKGSIPDKLYEGSGAQQATTPSCQRFISLHLIVSFVQSNLSKHLSDLSPLVGKLSSAVHNTKDFVDLITLVEGEILVFDVVCVFTYISTNLAIEVV